MPRTQKQRREETVARLLEASIATIIETGYARASAVAITQRAGLSDGALFRHFPTMSDFMAATAYEAMRRQLALFTERVKEPAPGRSEIEAVLTTLRDVTGNPTNAVLYELLIAARTDEKLRVALHGVLEEYKHKIYEIAIALPAAKRFPEGMFPAMVAVATSVFDGAAILRPVLDDPAIEQSRIPLLLAFLDHPAFKTKDESS